MTREKKASITLELMMIGLTYKLNGNEMLSENEADSTRNAIDALDVAIAALRGPEPDPDTGLMPCGCGGVTEQTDFHDGFFPHSKVDCLECGIEIMRAGNIIAEAHDEAKRDWNHAMGLLEVEG